MAFGNTFSSYDNLLKVYYSDDVLANEIFKDNPFLGMVKKFENAVGDSFVVPVVYGAGQGRSSVFATAQSMAALSGEQVAKFAVTRAENHAVANVSSQAIAASKNDKGAFIDAVTLIADDQLQNLSNDLGLGVFGSVDGARGQISSGSSVSSVTGVLSFVNPKDALHFEPGMQLDASANLTGTAVEAYGSGAHGLYVIAADHSACTITVGASVGGVACAANDGTNGIPTLATGDYLFQAGDKGTKMAGLPSWIPYGGPTATSFFGQDRTKHPSRLAGLSLNGQGGTLEEVLETAAANVCEQGGSLSHFLMPYTKLRALSQSLGSKAQLVDIKVSAQIGYKGIEVMGPKGPIVCVADRSCPSTSVFGINMASWQLNSIDKVAHIWDEDGKIWLRSTSDSGMEIRFYSLAQLVCKRPIDNINILVSA